MESKKEVANPEWVSKIIGLVESKGEELEDSSPHETINKQYEKPEFN